MLFEEGIEVISSLMGYGIGFFIVLLYSIPMYDLIKAKLGYEECVGCSFVTINAPGGLLFGVGLILSTFYGVVWLQALFVSLIMLQLFFESLVIVPPPV